MVILGFFALIALTFVLYSSVTTMHYRELRMEAVSMLIELEAEKVGRSIGTMERSAIHISMLGEQVYRMQTAPGQLGQYISINQFGSENFPMVGIGGGVWFEPYTLHAEVRHAGFYAYRDPVTGLITSASEYMSEEYDFHSQRWYREIKSELGARYTTAWSTPYTVEIGPRTLLTTVGTGIYDADEKLVGIATSDWEIQSLIDRLSAIQPTENSFVFLASPADDLIITKTRTGSNHAGEPLSSVVWYDELRFSDGDNLETGRFVIEGVEYMSFSRIFDNGWVFSIQIPVSEMFAAVESRNTNYSLLIGVMALILITLAAYLISRFVNRPLKKLTMGVAELGGGDLDEKIDIYSKDEIGMLAAAFNKMTVDLKYSIEQHAIERAEKERIGTELAVAATIQANMLPNIFPAFPERPEFDLYAYMQPAKEVGGDFYDFFMVDNNTLAIVIADVSGKGVPAALFMVIAKTLIKNNAQYGKSPKDVFETVNDLLSENNEADMFVTAFMGFLDIPTGKFTYVNAGHEPPLIMRKDGDYEKLHVFPNLMLAGMEDMVYRQEETVMEWGDMLFLYTDGVTEAANPDYDMFSSTRLLETANKNKSIDVKEFILHIRDEIDVFADGAEQADDITMLVLRIHETGNS